MHRDIFHFPRHELAEAIIKSLETGLASSKTLFAPRRMGKTEFILKDLIPAAKQNGYKAIYCNFWENKETPALSMLRAIESAKAGSSLLERAKNLGKTNINKLELNMELAGVKTGIAAELRPKTNTRPCKSAAL